MKNPTSAKVDICNTSAVGFPIPDIQVQIEKSPENETCKQAKINKSRIQKLYSQGVAPETVLGGFARRVEDLRATLRATQLLKPYCRTEGLTCSGPFPAVHSAFLKEDWRGRVPCKALRWIGRGTKSFHHAPTMCSNILIND